MHIHKPKSSYVQQERLEQASRCLKTVDTNKYFFLQYPQWSMEAGMSDHNSGLHVIFVNSVYMNG